MCGIAGIIGLDGNVAEAAARRMRAAMGHRGPDARGLEMVAGPSTGLPPVVLAHTRLAILDPTPAGRQPMRDTTEDGAAPPSWVVFNGEIFNFAALAEDLAARGIPPWTRCDTEVVLHAYRAWGESCVDRMRGMFAWCLVDPSRGTAWLCRDRLGVKPLYLARPRSGGLLFASEVRALLAAGPELVPTRVDPIAIESYLAQGGVWGEDAFLRDVTALGPGESLVVDWSGRPVRHSQYWRMPSWLGNGRHDREEADARIASLLRESVKLSLVSDVPIGLFLSGGVDSGALLALADEVSGTTVETLTVGFEGEQAGYDESEMADAVARRFGTKHHSIRLTDREVIDTVPRFLDAIDQPTSDGLNTFIISAAARQAGLKVALSGLGSDELFGGYPGFLDVPRAVSMRAKLRWARCLNPALARASSCLGGRRGDKGAELFRREPSLVAMYLLRREQFLPRLRRRLHALPGGSDPASGLSRALVDRLEAEVPEGDPVNRISWLELTTYTRDTLLRDTDVFSMAHGLEVRVPFLDHRLVEEVMVMPASWKRHNTRRKPLLVKAVGPRLPGRISLSDKRGFEMPIGSWLRGPLRPLVDDTLNDPDLWTGLGFNPAAPTRIWSRFLGDDTTVGAHQVFSLVVLAHYVKKHGLTLAS